MHLKIPPSEKLFKLNAPAQDFGDGRLGLCSSRAFVPRLDMLESPVPLLGTIAQAMASPRPLGIGIYSVEFEGSRTALPIYIVSTAFVPTPEMFRSPVPLLGTTAQAMASPYPFGIGIYTIDSEGRKKALPIYYVSPKMAAERGGGLRTGWYVVAVPETVFEVRLTNIQSSFPSINGVKISNGHEVLASLQVDGSFADSQRTGCSPRFVEYAYRGFLESNVRQSGSGQANLAIRNFTFQKAAAKESRWTTGFRDESSCIAVDMFSGWNSASATTSWLQAFDVNLGNVDVFEEQALKAGEIIQVARNGGKITETDSRSAFCMRDQKREGSLYVFLRESFWLKSRRVIDESGNPWASTMDGVVSDLGKRIEGDEMGGSTKKRVSSPRQRKLKK